MAMGHWEEIDAKWYEQKWVYCALTGRLISKKAWVAEIDGKKLTFSDPESEQLYREYVLSGHRSTKAKEV
jgi:hypothetical protein